MLAIAGGVARADTINFGQYADGTAITTQYAGVVSSGAEQMSTASTGGSYTPHSGGWLHCAHGLQSDGDLYLGSGYGQRMVPLGWTADDHGIRRTRKSLADAD